MMGIREATPDELASINTPPGTRLASPDEVRQIQSQWDLPETSAFYSAQLPVVPRTRESAGVPRSRQEQLASAINTAATFPRSIQGKMRAIAKAAPDARFELGPEGQIRVTIGDEKTILNKPGLSQADLQDVAVEELFQAPLIVAGGFAGRAVASTLGRVAGAALGGGVGSVARDIATGDDIDPVMAVISAASAGIFEAPGPLIIAGIRRATTVARYFRGGKLTKAGRDMLKRIGVSPDSVTPEFIKKFNRVYNEAENAIEAERMAAAQSLPEPVPLSRGDVTRNVVDQALESAGERGALGEEAAATAAGFRAGQQEALRANVPAVAAAVGEAGGVAGAQTALVAMRDALKNSVDAAYAAARAAGASLQAEAAKTLKSAVRLGLKDFSRAGAAPVFQQIDELDSLVNVGRARVRSINIKAFEQWRSQMSSLTRSNDAVVRKAAGQALGAYDEFMDSVVERGLLRGDASALEAFQKARGLRRELARKFESDRIVKMLVDDDALAVDPRQAANALFSASGLGAKRETVRAVRKIKSLLPEREFAKIKQDGFLRLFDNQFTGNIDAAENIVFSGKKFRTAWERAKQNAGALVKELFSEQDVQLIDQFARVATLAGDDASRVSGAVNFSNSGVLVALLDRMGFLGATVRRIVDPLIKANDSRQLRIALSNPLSMNPAPAVGAAAPAAASIAGGDENVRAVIGAPE